MQQSPSNPSVTAPLHKYHYGRYHLHAMPTPLERMDSITSFGGGTSGGTHYCRDIDGHVWRCNIVACTNHSMTHPSREDWQPAGGRPRRDWCKPRRNIGGFCPHRGCAAAVREAPASSARAFPFRRSLRRGDCSAPSCLLQALAASGVNLRAIWGICMFQISSANTSKQGGDCF